MNKIEENYMKEASPSTIYLKDYIAPAFIIKSIDLTITLNDTETLVESSLDIIKRQESQLANELILNGEELKLIEISINNRVLATHEFEESDNLLKIKNVPEKFILKIKNLINPQENKTLDGLYKSGNIFCTQNEPEGFRRITYYIDRPDNMAKFKTKIIADKKLYPVLLSNGNLIEKGDLDNGNHYVVWEDPFLKPSYLYALVAGDLGVIKDQFTTKSGRKVALEIYCDKGNESKCFHAMESLKKSMKWDEERFGLEYDLDIYMIVAVDAFNMGAMENKGLNIFNSAYVLADQKTATDQSFYGIESVIGHEYFHNWTGNRVTCRDWFQLTLKEGLTVYRDQEFSADLNSRAVERIVSVKRLKQMQFAEDAGPTSHPIKPSSYIEINNFYTATIYEKGAEIIRMYETLLGRDGFRKGMDKYFELFDGMAVRTEDFLYAMSVANNNYDFSQFSRWYHQNGTPCVEVKTNYDEKMKTFTIGLTQKSAANASGEQLPFHIPLNFGLILENGREVELKSKLIELKEKNQSYVFEGIETKPTLSINRNFTAPVKIISDQTEDDLLFLMAHDSDSFNRYDALQSLIFKNLDENIQRIEKQQHPQISEKFLASFEKLLKDETLDDAFKALCLEMPSIDLITQDQEVIKLESSKLAKDFLVATLATKFENLFISIYTSMVLKTSGEFKIDSKAMGARDLKDKTLYYLLALDNENYEKMAFELCTLATNMTDEYNALKHLVNNAKKTADEASKRFYQKYKNEKLVIQKWMALHSSTSFDTTFELVQKLEKDELYDETIPNFVRAIFYQFGAAKFQFHHDSGRGYKLLADKILYYDKMNPQVASRLASCFKDFKRLDSERKKLMKVELERIVKEEKISKNVYEIISKTLNS